MRGSQRDQPSIVGDLPLGCAAVCTASVSVQRMAMEAAVHGDDTLLRQAVLMDPLTGAVCNPPEVWQMVDEMLVAQEQGLPQYGKAIAEAKLLLYEQRIQAGYRPGVELQAWRERIERGEEQPRPRVYPVMATVATHDEFAPRFRALAEAHHMTLGDILSDTLIVYESALASGYRAGQRLRGWQRQAIRVN